MLKQQLQNNKMSTRSQWPLPIFDLWPHQEGSEMLGGVFQRGVNLFNLLLSAINALTGPVVGMIAPSVCCLCGGRV